MIVMPKVVGYKIMTPDMKTAISEHGPDDLEKCRKLIQGPRYVLRGDRKPTPVLQYIFKEIEEDDS